MDGMLANFVRWRMAAAFAAAATASAMAATPVSAQSFPPGQWVVDWGDQRCSLIRQNDGRPASIFALRTTPGSGLWEVRLLNPDWPQAVYSDANEVRIALGPQGHVLQGDVEVSSTPTGRAIVLYDLDQSDLPAFYGAQSLRVDRGDEPILDMPLPGMARGMIAVRECVDNVLRDWGVDPAALAALRSPPQGDVAASLRGDDYPEQAFRRNHQGTTVIRMAIDAQGRVMDCTTVESSGHEELDAASCGAVTRRFRAQPAIGADGSPTSAPMISAITWQID